MILAEDELAIGTDHAGIMVLDDELEPGTPLAEVLPIATDVLELEITPNRPDCLGDLRRRARGPRRHRRAAGGPAVGRRIPGAPGRSTGVEVDRRVPGPVPALHRARVRGRDDRPEPAVAEGAADGGRPAADLQRRRHHQLRDAADRPAAARVRPRPRRRRRADGAPRRATASRSTRSTARRARSTAEMVADRRRRRPDLDRRRDGRRALGGRDRHDAGADGGRHLERRQHPPHLARSSALRSEASVAVREAAAARAGAWRPRRWRRS